jgi:anti-anti-sigma factor
MAYESAVRSASDALDISDSDVDGVHVVGVSGGLDLAAAGAFCARVDAAREAGCRRLLLDLTQLRFCDSSGLRALIGAAKEMVANAGRVAVIPPAEGPVARLFALTGVPEFFPLHANVVDAQAALAERG